jgi:hypothetical protein
LRTNASSSGKQSHIESPRIENTDKAVGAMFSIIWESLRVNALRKTSNAKNELLDSTGIARRRCDRFGSVWLM